MPYLNLARGEPWAETWAVMHFPDDAAKRQAYCAKLWSGFYPAYEEAGAGELMPRSVLLSVMKAAAATDVYRDEIADRRYKGLAAGEQLKVVFALAQTEPELAAWNAAARLVEWNTGKSRAYLYDVRSVFLPVIHLWAAFILRDQRFYEDESCGYRAIDDLHVFIVEAMALLQWSLNFKLPRKKAEPTLTLETVDVWTATRLVTADFSARMAARWAARRREPRRGLDAADTIQTSPEKNLSNSPWTDRKPSRALPPCVRRHQECRHVIGNPHVRISNCTRA